MHTEVCSHQAGSEVCLNTEVDRLLSRSIARAIYRLWKAGRYAAETGRDIWEFAVSIAELRRDGISDSDLRWLVCRGYLEHANEIAATCSERKYDRHASLRFCKRTAFIITDAGVAFARESLERFDGHNGAPDAGADAVVDSNHPTMPKMIHDGHCESNGKILPKWDRDRRELRCDGQIVKVFKLPSPLQEV